MAPSSRTRVLIAGGGVAALEGMLALRSLAGEEVEIELLASEPHFWYRPLAVAEPFGLGRVHRFELAALASRAGARFAPGTLESVDPEAKVARTSAGAEIAYDALLLALGAKPVEAVGGALTFRGPADTGALVEILKELVAGTKTRVVFAVPGGISWPLPVYELALLTASLLQARGRAGTRVTLVTPEPEPLALFGPGASVAIGALLEDCLVELCCQRYPEAFDSDVLQLVPEGELEADVVVALPKLEGPWLPGIPSDAVGFVPTDETGRVDGLDNVYAAGDMTSFPIKQGGVAAQQADAAAHTIAMQAGAPVELEPFRAVLRGLLLTGHVPRFLRTDLTAWPEGDFQMDIDPLWWPPAKIAGRFLGPFLAQYSGYDALSGPPANAIPVEIDLSARVV